MLASGVQQIDLAIPPTHLTHTHTHVSFLKYLPL